jgi:hypothetical protein
MLGNEVSNLTVIDIDVKKDLEEEEREKIRNSVLSKLSEADVVVKTGGGGLHIYCDLNDFPILNNRLIKCFVTPGFEVDLLTSIDPSSRSLVVLPGLKVKPNNHEKITIYEFVQGSFDSVITRSLDDLFHDLDMKIKVDEPKLKVKTESIEANGEETIELRPQQGERSTATNVEDESQSFENEIDDKLAQKLVDGLFDFEIHNDGGDRKIEDEVTMFTLFHAINSLPEDFIKLAYKKVFNDCCFTENAAANYRQAKKRYSSLKTHPGVLRKIIKNLESRIL